VRVALAAVAEHRHMSVLDQGQVGVVVIEHGGHEKDLLDNGWMRLVEGYKQAESAPSRSC
jgi:hypothetical protein